MAAPRLPQARALPPAPVSRNLPPAQPRYSPQPAQTYSQPQRAQTYSTQPQTYSSQPQTYSSQPAQTYSQPQHIPQTSVNYAASPSSSAGASGPPSDTTIRGWASTQDFLDMYMVNAFYAGTAQRSQYFMSYWKTMCCFGLQSVGMIYLMQYQLEELKGSACASAMNWVSLVAFFFATYVSFYCREQIKSLHQYGMYQWGDQQPQWINSLWVGVGLWTNLFSLLVAWFCSIIIILLSPNILEMVLNAVAVTFMISLDDEIITASDYNRIVEWNGSQNTACTMIDSFYTKIGNLLLKIHPLWRTSYAFNFRGKQMKAEICDILLIPLQVIFPLIVLFCYSFPEEIEFEGI